VVKKNVDPNKMNSILFAALTLMQRRDDALVLSGECRAQILMKEMRTFISTYSFGDALQCGYLPVFHWRLLAPVLDTELNDSLSYGIPGTIASSPHHKPRPRGNRFGKKRNN
jgi:hypothetical protein